MGKENIFNVIIQYSVILCIFCTSSVYAQYMPNNNQADDYAEYYKYGTLKLKSQPSGARVIVNGQEVGITPLYVDKVVPGVYTIEIKRNGYKDLVGNFRIEGGTILEAFGTMEKAADKAVFGVNMGYQEFQQPLSITLSDGWELLGLHFYSDLFGLSFIGFDIQASYFGTQFKENEFSQFSFMPLTAGLALSLPFSARTRLYVSGRAGIALLNLMSGLGEELRRNVDPCYVAACGFEFPISHSANIRCEGGYQLIREDYPDKQVQVDGITRYIRAGLGVYLK